MRSINIHPSSTRIVIETIPAEMRIEQKQLSFRIKNPSAQMRIETERPRMSVDWSSVWAQMGRKLPYQQMEYQKFVNVKKASEAIGAIAAEGDQLSAIDKSVGLGDVAAQKMIDIPETNVQSIPEQPPQVEWEKGDITITWELPPMELEWSSDFRPDMEFTPCTVEISVIGLDEVKFAVDEEKVSRSKSRGKLVNTKV